MVKGCSSNVRIVSISFFTWIGIINELDPVYGLPKAAFHQLPAWASILDIVPIFICLFGIAMVLMTISVWRKRYMNIIGRTYYTVLTVLAVNLIWFFTTGISFEYERNTAICKHLFIV